jgi:diaminopimelate epimerase
MTPFFLLSGAGNDFLALAEPARRPTGEEIRAWCRRGLSVGADGLFVLDRSSPPSGRTPAVGMEYWNADGRPAELCLNGARCAARLAFSLGWARERVLVVSAAGAMEGVELDGSVVRLEGAPLPRGAPEELVVATAAGELRGSRVVVGVPHFVLEVADVAAAAVATVGPIVRWHEAFASAGTNVDFVARAGPSHLALRTWERGVEAETLACGTGVLAAVAVLLESGRLTLPATVRTRGGFALEVGGSAPGGTVERWSLSGDARLLARGELLSGAAVGPQATAVC